MKRRALFITIFAAFFAPRVMGQDKAPCPYVAREVSFENTRGLAPEQVQKLQTLVLGRCYDPVNAVFISQYVYDQLRDWGYCKATVYDPNDFRILDQSVQPAPIAVTIDFLLTAPEEEQKQSSLNR